MDSKLVDKIVEEVIVALGRQGPAGRQGVQTRSPIAPPVPARPTGRSGTPAGTPNRPAGKLFVTEEMLRQRLAGGKGNGIIELAHNEFLTPNAADLAAQRHLTIRKAAGTAARRDNPGEDTPPAEAIASGVSAPVAPAAPAGESASIGLVTDRLGQKVRGAIDALRYDGIALRDFNRTDCLVENLRSMCRAITSSALSAGVAILPYAADAMVLTNKIKGIRAVQGTRPRSVSAALRHFGANVLIIEHAFCTFHEIRTMARLFAAARTAQPLADVLLSAVAELEGEGV